MADLEDTPDTLSKVYSMVGLFPIWSVLSQLVAGVILVGTQNLLLKNRTTRKYFDVLNEFLCTFAWVWWSMETILLSYMRSPNIGLLSVFIRLVIYPYISHGAPNNPLTALYVYFNKTDPTRRYFSRFCLSVAIQLFAMVLALVYCHYYWKLLGVMVSSDHLVFLEAKLNYFLRTSPTYGFLSELFISFAMYLPSIFLPPSFFLTVIDSAFVIVLIVNFNTLTGAFMNPISALFSTLYWHDLASQDYLVHIVVFWLGPFVGTRMAALVYDIVHANKQQKLL